MIVIVMGVSGCGKTTVARELSKRLKLPFFDADSYHPQENIDKMSGGKPLNDEDRASWLEILSSNLQQWEEDKGAVLACSALKEKYRKTLSTNLQQLHWVYLDGSYELIMNRINQRTGHYMSGQLLKSQFEALEIPQYGIHVDIDRSPKEIVDQIITNMESKKSEFGVFGLGVMGSSISLNIADKGYQLSVYNRADGGEEDVVDDFLSKHSGYQNIRGFTELKAFILSLSRPRKILIMIKAGPTVDLVLGQLFPLLEKGDIIIDGGNSHFKNTKKRYDLARQFGVEFIGAGISGGEEGARKGPSIMPGGTAESYNHVSDILESIAAKDDFGKTCCTYIGPEGSGHFIKMVHNGIEYVEMQLLAEIYTLLSKQMDYQEIASLFKSWNNGEAYSYLLDITIRILEKKEGDTYLLDVILDKAGNKGTGSWSSKAAFDLGIPNTMMSSAVFARYISSFKEARVKMAAKMEAKNDSLMDVDLKSLEKAYRFGRLINHQQGFMLMESASNSYGWNLNFSEIARIWSNGCIIKSHLMNELHEEFKTEQDLMQMNSVFNRLKEAEESVKEILSLALEKRVSMHCLTASYHYWIDMTSSRLSANLIQAQRDFFGAHTYQRTDAPESEYFHTNWL
ncbi:NADP-dependent phosphogluconate dehydrogenase [Lutimonas zeaxanthinifaciens]|uniref:NADP-dependent phosphogluconate dehydrogenase n=1 Tax=Lutimonas zeaxanthinifaciens TaxID=3060215 RepID=UPI00265CF3FF|nr:NADP-dependent phosphogluconate dehydrogenase [Lutimonas sp. YSD2104]WKK66892.1 NADP-dependent phosphogluconate dehydrogenase [Lutimonas sp. YSD2104]